MKITKTQLKALIKEELSGALSESEQWQMGRSMKAADLAAESGAGLEDKLVDLILSQYEDAHGRSPDHTIVVSHVKQMLADLG